MGKVRYIPSQPAFDRYYHQQGKGDIFAGPAYQRGHGLGGLFGRLFRAAVPVFKQTVASALKNAGKAAAKEALLTGVQVANDLMDGQSLGSSLENRVPKATNRLAQKSARKLRSILEDRQPRRPMRKSKKKSKTIKGRDIFA